MLKQKYLSAILFFMLISIVVPTSTPAGARPVNDTPVGTTGVNQLQSIVSHWEGTISPDPLNQSGEIAPNAASNNTLSFDLTYDANGVPNQLTYEMSAIHATINGDGDLVCYNGWSAHFDGDADLVGATLPGFYVQDYKEVSTTDFFSAWSITGLSGHGTGLPGDIGLDNAEGNLLLYYNDPAGIQVAGTCNWAWQATCTSNCLAGPAKLAFSQATYEVREDAGSVTITVVRTGNPDGQVTVDWATSDGTAVDNQDYDAWLDTLTFPSGLLQKTFSLTIIGDPILIPEGLEYFNVTLSNPTNGAELGTPSTARVIIDDRSACDGAPTHCLPNPFRCPAPPPGCWQTGYGFNRNFINIEGWGNLDNADSVFVDSCTIVRDFETCVDEAAACAYQCVPVPPPADPPSPLITATQPITAQLDLGDAPDSSNNTSQAMTAYPGINAQFPTVKGGASPYGPRHNNPLPVAGWLGPWITAESEADIGTDADPTNNLIPTSDTADQDGADDGVALPIPISHCVSSPVQFAVTVPENAPPGVEWKVNVWFDWNRDGKWGDVLTCGSDQAPEWAVQNLMLGELDPGYHFFYTPFLPYNADPSQPIWMRITLSDDSAISADGSGPDTDYDYGETEDYYLLTADLQPWSSSEIAPGTTYDLTFNQMGNYPYHVQQRPVVKGGIFVRPAAATQLQRSAVTLDVRITDTGLVPLVTTIAVGDTVRWHNDTTTSHTLVGDVLVIATAMERIYLPLVLR